MIPRIVRATHARRIASLGRKVEEIRLNFFRNDSENRTEELRNAIAKHQEAIRNARAIARKLQARG